jgi:hypothetical protein
MKGSGAFMAQASPDEGGELLMAKWRALMSASATAMP